MKEQGDSAPSLWDLDRDVREQIATANPEIARLCEIGLRLLASGVTVMAGKDNMQPNEMVMAMAASQISNSLRSAVNGGRPAATALPKPAPSA